MGELVVFALDVFLGEEVLAFVVEDYVHFLCAVAADIRPFKKKKKECNRRFKLLEKEKRIKLQYTLLWKTILPNDTIMAQDLQTE